MGWSVSRWEGLSDLDQCFGGRSDEPKRSVATLRQVHGRTVRHFDDVVAGETQGDGLVADRPGCSVGVWTADCVPVHLVAPRHKVAAAIHCGWRGTAAGILPEALALLRERWNVAPRDLEAALGPAIGGCCYEVGGEVRDAFVARVGDALSRCAFEARQGRLHLDLRTFLAAELATLGIIEVERVGPCTGCRPDLLHSYRKQGGPGRQLSWIGWQ
jgi:YfiH family protein